MKSHDKLEVFYLHFHNACGNKTWHESNFYWETSTHKIKKPYNHTVLGDDVTSKNHNISTTTMNIATKLARAEIYNEELPSLTPQGLLIKLS